MSQSAAKASRRSIRKALGPKTVDTVVSLAAGLDNHAEAIELLTRRVLEVNDLIHASDKALQGLRAIQREHADKLNDFGVWRGHSSLLDRLRWVFTGYAE